MTLRSPPSRFREDETSVDEEEEEEEEGDEDVEYDEEADVEEDEEAESSQETDLSKLVEQPEEEEEEEEANTEPVIRITPNKKTSLFKNTRDKLNFELSGSTLNVFNDSNDNNFRVGSINNRGRNFVF